MEMTLQAYYQTSSRAKYIWLQIWPYCTHSMMKLERTTHHETYDCIASWNCRENELTPRFGYDLDSFSRLHLPLPSKARRELSAWPKALLAASAAATAALDRPSISIIFWMASESAASNCAWYSSL